MKKNTIRTSTLLILDEDDDGGEEERLQNNGKTAKQRGLVLPTRLSDDINAHTDYQGFEVVYRVRELIIGWTC